MSQEEFETTQVISTICFDLVRRGYSLDEIRSGLGNTMSAVGSGNGSKLVDTQDLLDEQKRLIKELSDQVGFYCDK
ncbi:hypothetical protein ABC426_17170 [Lactiplantibacillus plantarum]|uniref:hypothetical protein n=1 Tax=Lactiplantibacillus plantarum TaxID=1590 RepID=UPI001BA4E127|nr:hypothetical protein [Lactiplantibacillus plantarum]MBS0953064.1 hypothetical protein [Lactiplantibacillus plantarum]